MEVRCGFITIRGVISLRVRVIKNNWVSSSWSSTLLRRLSMGYLSLRDRRRHHTLKFNVMFPFSEPELSPGDRTSNETKSYSGRYRSSIELCHYVFWHNYEGDHRPGGKMKFRNTSGPLTSLWIDSSKRERTQRQGSGRPKRPRTRNK